MQPFIVQNLIPNEPELKDLLALYRKQTLLGLSCHHIGTIQDFNELDQTASVQIVYKKTVFQPNAASGGYSPVLIDYPVLIDCPVIFLGGGPASLTFPVDTGDECILLFNDRDMDNWFSGAPNGPVATPRLHSFSDAIALVGVRSLPNSLIDFDTDRAVLQYGEARLAVGESTASVEFGTNSLEVTEDQGTLTIGSATLKLTATDVTVTIGPSSLKLTTAGKFSVTNATAEFVAALVQLFTDIGAATAGGFPLIMATFPTDLAKLQTFQS